MTNGAYIKPKTAPNNQLNVDVNPAFTISETQLPIVQPIGPKMTCAANTVGTKANNGTKIIEIA